MFDLNFLRLKIGRTTHFNGDVSNFVNFKESGSILNTATITFDFGVDLSLEMEEDLSVLNNTVIHVTRGTDASIRGR